MLSKRKQAQVLVVMGPTASGKSALAVQIAEKVGGVIINCDAMQVYQDLHIITARPVEEEMAGIPHQLYGVIPASVRFNAAQWVKFALPEIEGCLNFGKIPVLVGGTGLYVKALMEGLSEMPEIPVEVRGLGVELLHNMGNGAFYTDLCKLDPYVQEKLEPGDTQRMLRAWEVMHHTGTSIYDWQVKNKAIPPTEYDFKIISLQPPREDLYARVNQRFEQMVSRGALAEVKALKDQNLDPTLPAMKAHGVPELIQHLEGEISREEAVAKAQQNTRNYVKRQLTWLRHQLKSDIVVEDFNVDPQEILKAVYLRS